MTSALRGRQRVGQRKGGCVDLVLRRGREGVQNPENLADVICERPLSPPPLSSVCQVHYNGPEMARTQPPSRLLSHDETDTLEGALHLIRKH